MTDRVLVEALRRRDPGALAALYDTYAESIHEFCLLSLGNLDGAQVALRDTLIAAEAHIAALADPARLRVWLFTLARAECGRRRMPAALSGTPPIAAQAPAVPDLEGAASADLRFMAWNAAWSLTAADREILYLTVRHHLTPAEIAVVTASSAREIEAGLGVARDRLRDAVTAEVLARKGPYDCPRRADILTGFAGELTPAMREQVVRHLARCDTCAPHRARQVSAAKVFDLLPAVPLPESLRVRVMSCFTDPELVAYRRYVARRVGLLDAAGFPAAGIKGIAAAIVSSPWRWWLRSRR
ncbi:hypothetical protein [Thermocatellispora tengchongensis]|uniref:hypothetical protein n=1 Tax=Thermocatellispora tengchongensis TaxID=1073253 RepID=UPI00362A6ADF